MKLLPLLGSAAGIALALILLLPAKSGAYSTIGGMLDLNQRDVRIFNNFTDLSANDNATPDPNFPGAYGAELAVWKGVVEWGSTLFGDGSGDPSQPGGLGSGGANFDALWGGRASSAGGRDDNIVMEIPGSSGGIASYTETPIADGWRILFYRDPWIIHDGPDAPPLGYPNLDLQGSVTRQYGAALGLGNSQVSGSTMYGPVVQSLGYSLRSIEADDIAGVQSIYGVASPIKARITGASFANGIVTIVGVGFHATTNEVRFTPADATPGSTANPLVVVTWIPSTGGGTQIQLPLPAGAGRGNVAVKGQFTAHSSLSNAWPLDLPGTTCPPPTMFCDAGENSFSQHGAVAGLTGTQSVAANDLVLTATGVPPNKLGLFYYGQNLAAPVAFGNGSRCIASPFFRLPTTTSDALGQVTFAVDLANLPPGGQVQAGESWGFQLWYRDPDAGGANFNASGGIRVPFCP